MALVSVSTTAEILLLRGSPGPEARHAGPDLGVRGPEYRTPGTLLGNEGTRGTQGSGHLGAGPTACRSSTREGELCHDVYCERSEKKPPNEFDITAAPAAGGALRLTRHPNPVNQSMVGHFPAFTSRYLGKACVCRSVPSFGCVASDWH